MMCHGVFYCILYRLLDALKNMYYIWKYMLSLEKITNMYYIWKYIFPIYIHMHVSLTPSEAHVGHCNCVFLRILTICFMVAVRSKFSSECSFENIISLTPSEARPTQDTLDCVFKNSQNSTLYSKFIVLQHYTGFARLL